MNTTTPKPLVNKKIDYLPGNPQITLEQLYTAPGIEYIHSQFLKFIQERALPLFECYQQIQNQEKINLIKEREEISSLIIEFAPLLEDYITQLFALQNQIANIKKKSLNEEIKQKCRKMFIQKVVNNVDIKQLPNIDETRKKLASLGLNTDINPHNSSNIEKFERQFASKLIALKNDSADFPYFISYAAWAVHNPEGQKQHRDSTLFSLIQPREYDHLIPNLETDQYLVQSQRKIRNRYGFSLNDPGINPSEASKNSHHCLICHNRGKDSCSIGMRTTGGKVATNPLSVPLEGCPLEEKISEMNLLKNRGYPIAALAVAMIDNPLLAATGHRICNDCTLACIYQKQDPVNIPMVETSIFEEVLYLPWGFEIYSLLTRWNPLNFSQPIPQQYTGKKVLIVGAGPAGFTMAHYMLRLGIGVVLIDGCKIEPLPPAINSVEYQGERVEFAPIVDVKGLFSDLNDRQPEGFGGVMEYGITVRWNKNYLRVIRIILERNKNFRLYGSTRFGSSFNYDTASELEFDHVILAMGAGEPRLPQYHGKIMENLLSPGVRMASDFLMNLQTIDVTNPDSIANLQIELPIVVIGGGLTAVDAATESLNYYAAQVERFLQREEEIQSDYITRLTAQEAKLATTFKQHANLLRNHPESQRQLLQKWGGATIVYRRKMVESPAYRNNHHELAEALAEGICFMENAEIIKIVRDGLCRGIECVNKEGNKFTLLGKTILVAVGTEPSDFLNRELNNNEEKLEKNILQEEYLRHTEGSQNEKLHNIEGQNPLKQNSSTQPRFAPGKKFSLHDNMLLPVKTSIIGDMHPSYVGSVVKAMASAKHAAKEIYLSLYDAEKSSQNLDKKCPQEISYPGNYAQSEQIKDRIDLDEVDIYKLYTTITEKFSLKTDLDPAFVPEIDVTKMRQITKINHKQIDFTTIDEKLLSFVESVQIISNNNQNGIVELTIRSPLAARKFQPGQFFRLQTYSQDNTAMPFTISGSMEPLALTGAKVDKDCGTITFIILEMGGSSNLCRYIKPGQPVALMGPCGTPTILPQAKTVMLVGGGVGNAVLFSVAEGMKKAGCRIIYFAGYRKIADRYKTGEIEENADVVVWCCEEGVMACNREQDIAFRGNIIEGIEYYIARYDKYKKSKRKKSPDNDIEFDKIAIKEQGLLLKNELADNNGINIEATIFATDSDSSTTKLTEANKNYQKQHINENNNRNYIFNEVFEKNPDAENNIENLPQQNHFSLNEIEYLFVVGSPAMMKAIAECRLHGALSRELSSLHLAYGSVNSPMQCMMKKICAQCLQAEIDPVSGEINYVYSCVNQDQKLDWIDFNCLQDRLMQNTLCEKQTAAWMRQKIINCEK